MQFQVPREGFLQLWGSFFPLFHFEAKTIRLNLFFLDTKFAFLTKSQLKKLGGGKAQRSDFLKRSGSLEERAFMLGEPVSPPSSQLDIKERPVTSLRVQGGEGEDGAQRVAQKGIIHSRF